MTRFCERCTINPIQGSGRLYCDECRTRDSRRLVTCVMTSCIVCDESSVLGLNRCDREQCKKELDWRRNLFRVHHIRAEQFYSMVKEQKWACAICKNPLIFHIDGSKSDINVDHDHSCCPGRIGCGKCVRGITCSGCNGGMGLFKDSPENLIAAAKYLIEYQEGKKFI